MTSNNNNNKNRRSKKSVAANRDQTTDKPKSETKSSKVHSNSNSSNNHDESVVSLEEQLDRALLAVTSGYDSTLKLHHAWRSQLQRISILILVVIASECKAPGSLCLASIQEWNRENNDEDSSARTTIITSNATILALMMKDSAMEGMSLCCSLCLVLWVTYLPTQQTQSEFSSLYFRVASALLPLIVYAYTQDRYMGCLRHLTQQQENDQDAAAALPSLEKRPFPVVLIFYIVTTLSILAMTVQRRSGEENIRKVQALKEDLIQSKKKK